MAEKNSYKVSVIIPVYGVEDFVGRCAESLMSQTLADVEFIFVDDCTPDNSIFIIKETISHYPNRLNHCKILHHSANKGLPAARNTGMDVASGDYIFHCDSDDFLEPDMLEKLYNKAVETNADMVWSDWYLSFEGNERKMLQPDAECGREALSLVLNGAMKYNVWNKLTRRELYEKNNIKFPAGASMGEDMTMIRLLACAGTTAHVKYPLYHYLRTNSWAMTQIYSDRHLKELKQNVSETISFLKNNISDNDIEKEINLFKLNVKLPFLFTGRKKDIKIWREWFPEANKYIMSNKNQALRTRMLQWIAANKMSWINLLYTRFIYNFIYGIIYR